MIFKRHSSFNRNRKHFLFIITGFILVSCSSVVLTGRKQLMLVPDSEVLSSSFQSYKEFIDSVPASTNKTQTEMVVRVGKRIQGAVESYLQSTGMSSSIQNYAWEFHLLKDSQVNAFCMPGGKVAFFEGIMPIAKIEAGVAVVMGHEVAHAIAKHSNERLSQGMIAQYGASLTDILFSNKSQLTRATISTLYGLGTQYGLLLPYSRNQELEADRLGLIFMAMAGYNPNEGIAFWQRMAANGSSSTPEFMSTHPSDATRQAKMKEYIAEAMQYYKKK